MLQKKEGGREGGREGVQGGERTEVSISQWVMVVECTMCKVIIIHDALHRPVGVVDV